MILSIEIILCICLYFLNVLQSIQRVHRKTCYKYETIQSLLQQSSKSTSVLRSKSIILDELYSYKAVDSITFISSNMNKVKEVQSILGTDFPWDFKYQSMDLFELQGNPVEISTEKCKQAIDHCDGPVIVEDTSLCFNALNGLPGPYVKWFYESIGNQGLYKMLDGYEDKTCYAQCILSFSLGKGHDIKVFVGASDGVVVEPKGENNFGWDSIFQPVGYHKTFAEMERSEKNKISHRYKAFREFKSYINSKMVKL